MDFGNQCGDRALGIVLESKGNYLSRRMRMPGRLGPQTQPVVAVCAKRRRFVRILKELRNGCQGFVPGAASSSRRRSHDSRTASSLRLLVVAACEQQSGTIARASQQDERVLEREHDLHRRVTGNRRCCTVSAGFHDSAIQPSFLR
jgi:hypothetical protein